MAIPLQMVAAVSRRCPPYSRIFTTESIFVTSGKVSTTYGVSTPQEALEPCKFGLDLSSLFYCPCFVGNADYYTCLSTRNNLDLASITQDGWSIKPGARSLDRRMQLYRLRVSSADDRGDKGSCRYASAGALTGRFHFAWTLRSFAH